MPLGEVLVRELLGLPSSKGALIPIAVGQPMDARSWVLSDIAIFHQLGRELCFSVAADQFTRAAVESVLPSQAWGGDTFRVRTHAQFATRA